MTTLREKLTDANNSPSIAIETAPLWEVMELMEEYDPHLVFLMNSFINGVVGDILVQRIRKKK